MAKIDIQVLLFLLTLLTALSRLPLPLTVTFAFATIRLRITEHFLPLQSAYAPFQSSIYIPRLLPSAPTPCQVCKGKETRKAARPTARPRPGTIMFPVSLPDTRPRPRSRLH
ncbi:hypothetical protein A0H81_05126 [Grifola frondosa]|uniref:Uncharacterized protein n=1 Tax=Grifola frondosa TaxID=5627 RepID=A0A1C7MDG3_GRIFR|nr:hypothetical protein A0H81_05126 [Grifola frondosa]